MARVIVIAAVAHAAVIVFIIVVLTARCQQATGLMNIFKLKHIMCSPYSLSLFSKAPLSFSLPIKVKFKVFTQLIYGYVKCDYQQ